MARQFARKIVAATIALVTGSAILTGASSAQADGAEQPVIMIFTGPISKNSQKIGVLTHAPSGTPLEVHVNGVFKGATALRTFHTGETYISYDRAWGLGTLQLRYGPTLSARTSMLAAVKINYSFKRFGPGAKRLRAKVSAKRYHPGKNRWVKTAKPLIQAKMGSWKTVKKVRLNKKGKGQAAWRPAKAFHYRIVVKKTPQASPASRTTLGKI